MATKRVDFVVSEKGAAKTKAGLKGVDNQFVSMAKNAIAAGVAMGAIHKGVELTKLAADAVNVEKAFRNLSKEPDKMLQAMKKAVGGTIAEFELMKQFNQAALLGLPLDRFDEMISIARGAAVATGQSMDFMLNSIVTGIGRQSKLMIDNLGILVSVEDANNKYAASLRKTSSQLTDLEKKTAFANAVLDAGAKNLENMGGAAEGAFDGVNALTVLVKDTTIDAFKNLVSPVNNAALAVHGFISAVSWMDAGTLTVEQRIEALKELLANRFTLSVDEANAAFSKLGLGAFDVANGLYEWDRVQTELNEAVALANAPVERQTKAVETQAKATRELNNLLFVESKLMNGQVPIVNDLRTSFEKLTASALESGLKGLAMSQNLGEASRALANQYVVEGVFGAVKGALTEVPFPLNLLAAGAAGIAANALFNQMVPVQKAATGADFTTSGPQLMLVGEAGREHVSVTPLEGPNINGPQGGITIQVMGDFIGNQDFVESNIIPAINLATRQGRAAIA